MNTQHDKELMELKHDPVPGYKPVFVVVFTIACLIWHLSYFIHRFKDFHPWKRKNICLTIPRM